MTIAEHPTPSGSYPDEAPYQASADDDLAWLSSVLGIVPVGVDQRYLGRSSGDELHLLLPTHPPAAACASLRRSDSNRALSTVVAQHLGRAAAALGLLSVAPGERLSLPRFALVEHLATRLGEPKLVAAVTIGQRRRNRKPVLQLIRPDGHVVGFAKVGWSPLTNGLVANEAEVLSLVEGKLGHRLRAPRVLCREPWRDGHVVVTSPLTPRTSTDAVIGAVAERRSSPDTNDIIRAIAAAGGRDRRPTDSLDVWQEWDRLGVGQTVDLEGLRHRHRGTVVDTGLWHGDFTPWNLRFEGSSVSIWDWEFAGLGRPVGFDALHSNFEQHRRAPGGSNREALDAVVGRSPGILRSLEVGDLPAEREAIVDLYLCELVARECQLDGQRWSGGAVARLAPEASALLQRRSER